MTFLPHNVHSTFCFFERQTAGRRLLSQYRLIPQPPVTEMCIIFISKMMFQQAMREMVISCLVWEFFGTPNWINNLKRVFLSLYIIDVQIVGFICFFSNILIPSSQLSLLITPEPIACSCPLLQYCKSFRSNTEIFDLSKIWNRTLHGTRLTISLQVNNSTF